jgi:hypothetical protein
MRKFRLFGVALLSTLMLASCSSKKESNSDASAPTGASSTATQDVSSKSAENWDEIIKNYGEYVDKYIVLAQKASKGDASALQEYPAMMEKATELSDKLDKAKEGTLTPEQVKRFSEIAMKMANAAMPDK